jgi:hypothetical protein
MKRLFLLLLMCAAFASVSLAQGTNTSISGIVTDVQGELLTGATIIIRNQETGFTTGTTTGLNGSYIIQQIPLGNNYSITISYTGFVSQRIENQRINQGDQLRIDFQLVESTEILDEITIVADPMSLVVDRMGSKTSITRSDLESLPVNGRNFVSLIDLSPVSRGNNLLGQLFSSTNYTIDGMTNRSPLSSGTTNRGPFSISMEAIREFEIVTNSYDVTHGRSGGGLISAVTRSGTNQLEGSGFYYNRADFLSSQYDTRGNRRSDEFSISQYGFTLGGPIVNDKIHFFVTYDGQFDARPLLIADIQTQQDEITAGLSRQSLDRYLQIARDQYGVSNSPQTGSFDKRRVTHTFFGRLDWQLDDRNVLTVRNNFTRDNNNDGVSDNSRVNLYEVYGTHISMANSFMTSLRTNIASNLTNELKLQHLYTLDDGRPNSQLPAGNIPRAIVERVQSEIDGQTYNTTIQIGGQRYLPETFESNVFQVVNNLYYSSPTGINYTFGTDIMLNNLSSLATSEFNGRFFFTGLDNFENRTPYRYAREVATVDPEVTQLVLGSGIYAQADMSLSSTVDLTVGLRGDYTRYLNSPEFNQVVLDDLGLRTDQSASGFQLQPRFQLTWNVAGKNTDFIKLGGGIFGSALNNYSDVNNLQFDGTKIFALDVRGANVPTPDFPSYRNDPSTAPGAELFLIDGIEPLTTINMNSENIKVPTVYKGNISYNKFFGERLRLGANFIASFARNNYMYVDRNMVDEPYFRLANEGNRGVFVPANTINTANGSADWTQGRKTNRIGRVLELVSEGSNDTYTVVVDGTYRYYRDGMITASYTWNDARDNTSYNGNVANSATLFQMVGDDPRDLSRMSYSNVQFRNKVVVYGSLPSFYGVNVGVRYSGLGGTRYSLRVNGNVNGDFVSSNDLAFVFDPADPNTSAAIAEGIENVLNNENNLARDCIREQLGTIAMRNGCENDFFGTWDLRVSRKFNFSSQSSTGIELSLDVFNVANLIDREKGTTKNLGDQNLLTIRGFDPVTEQYIYAVNQNVGVINPGGTPWQFQVSARVFF